MYARVTNRILHYLNNPELLETAPESVRFEENNVYSMPATKARRFRRRKQESIAG